MIDRETAHVNRSPLQRGPGGRIPISIVMVTYGARIIMLYIAIVGWRQSLPLSTRLQ